MTLVLLAVLAAGPAKAKVEVPAITEEWLRKAADCEAKSTAQAVPGETLEQALDRAVAADKAFTDDVAVSCGFASRAQHDRFRVRVSAAVTEVMAPMALKQLELLGGGSKGSAVFEARQKRELKEGKISRAKYEAMIALNRQTERAEKAYQAWSKRKAPKSLDVSLLMLTLRNVSVGPGYDAMIEDGKATLALKKRALAELEAVARRTEAWAKEQPALADNEIAAQADWLQKNNLATQKAAGP
jgi:hypothetical protein